MKLIVSFFVVIVPLSGLAAETASPPEPGTPTTAIPATDDAPNVTKTQVTASGIGEVTLTVSDYPNPEPVDTPVVIEVTLKCISSTLDRKVGHPIKGCAFNSARYDTNLRALVVHYKKNVLDANEGILKCTGSGVATRRLSCSAPTAPSSK